MTPSAEKACCTERSTPTPRSCSRSMIQPALAVAGPSSPAASQRAVTYTRYATPKSLSSVRAVMRDVNMTVILRSRRRADIGGHPLTDPPEPCRGSPTPTPCEHRRHERLHDQEPAGGQGLGARLRLRRGAGGALRGRRPRLEDGGPELPRRQARPPSGLRPPA